MIFKFNVNSRVLYKKPVTARTPFSISTILNLDCLYGSNKIKGVVVPSNTLLFLNMWFTQ